MQSSDLINEKKYYKKKEEIYIMWLQNRLFENPQKLPYNLDWFYVCWIKFLY